MRLLGALVGFAMIVSTPAWAQKVTPWGDPDLQGVWTNQTPIPLERPPDQAAFFTEEEAAEFEATALERLLGDLGESGARGELTLSGELNAIWLETADGRVGQSRRTSLIVDPVEGTIPYTPDGRERWLALPTGERLLRGDHIGSDRPEDRTPSERCLPLGALFVPNPFYNNYHRIVQAPGHVAIVSEEGSEVRVIRLDDRPLPLGGVRQWLGDSRGRWEGETLVVETTHFNDRLHFRGATRGLRVVERFTRLDADTIGYRLTVMDPDTFARPWTLENSLRRSDGQIYESACHEGNYGMVGILSGARVEEEE